MFCCLAVCCLHTFLNWLWFYKYFPFSSFSFLVVHLYIEYQERGTKAITSAETRWLAPFIYNISFSCVSFIGWDKKILRFQIHFTKLKNYQLTNFREYFLKDKIIRHLVVIWKWFLPVFLLFLWPESDSEFKTEWLCFLSILVKMNFLWLCTEPPGFNKGRFLWEQFW